MLDRGIRMPKYCPTCGNSSDKMLFYGNFCESCTKEKFSKTLVKEVQITACKRCGRIKAAGAYVPLSYNNLEIAVEQSMGKYKVRLLSYENNAAKVEVSDTTEYGPISVEHELGVTYKRILCETCYKKACMYHEAVIQLRGNPQKIEKFQDKISRYFDARNEFVTKVEQSDHGVDMYMSSKRMVTQFISRLGLKPTTSFTLTGVKNGKRIYKNTYALRFE